MGTVKRGLLFDKWAHVEGGQSPEAPTAGTAPARRLVPRGIPCTGDGRRRALARPHEPPSLYRRLSLLMALQWAIPGALLPLYSLRLHQLRFDELTVGACC